MAKKSTFYAILFLLILCQPLAFGKRQKAASTSREDIDEVYQDVVNAYNGASGFTPAIKNLPPTVLLVLELARSKKAPLYINDGNKDGESRSKLSLDDLRLCRGKYSHMADFYNQFTNTQDRLSLISGVVACNDGKESGDYWKAPRVNLLYHSFHKNPEVGVSQLDPSSSNGNQSLCIKQFKTWIDAAKPNERAALAKSLGVPLNPVAGPRYAQAADQRYNIACGTYFYVSALLADQEKNGGKCASVVPRNHSQYGHKDQVQFVHCMNRLTETGTMVTIKNGLRDFFGKVSAFFSNDQTPRFAERPSASKYGHGNYEGI